MDKPSELEREFAVHLGKVGNVRTVEQYARTVRRFLKHVDENRIDRISEELTRSFFTGKAKNTLHQQAAIVGQFLAFAHQRLPAVVDKRGREKTSIIPRERNKKELALRQRWSIDRIVAQKEHDDDLIAKLARKVIDGYLICQQQIKGERNLDDLVRFVDECRELIEVNLPLFVGLSAQGRNIHSAIDERVQR